jgi:hypothetical protein
MMLPMHSENLIKQAISVAVWQYICFLSWLYMRYIDHDLVMMEATSIVFAVIV